MTQYEKNLKVLSKYYDKFDELIEKGRKELKPDFEIIEETADDGGRILRIRQNGKMYYLNGKRNSKESALLWRDALGELQQNTPIIMMGTGNPSYLKELAEQTENKITIIVYEPSLQIFLKFLEMADLERWMEKHLIIFWVNGLEEMGLQKLQPVIKKTLIYEMLVYVKYFILPNYEILFEKEAVDFMRICRDAAAEEAVQYNTNIIFSKVMVKNLLSNARYLCKGYKTTQLINLVPKDVPGILVAAGPSLNKNIKDLKEAQGKSFIIAVDTAVKPLLREGIVPHMIAMIDGMKPLSLFEAEGVKEIPLLTSLSAASEVLDYHTGMKIFYNQGYQFADRIFQKSGQMVGGVATGGSVATSVFSFMYMIGITTIILVGQDLAFTNNRSHADGTFQEVMEECDTSNYIMVEGNCEDKVPAPYSFQIFIKWYEQYIEGCTEHKKNRGEQFRVINATEGGAKIKGTEIMTLKDAIHKVCTKEADIAKRIKDLKPMLSEEEYKWAENYLLNLSEDFHTLSLRADKMKKQYHKLNRLCSKKNINQQEYLSVMKKLRKGIKEITQMDVYQLVNMTMSNANYILSNEQFLSEDTLQKEGKEIARKGIIYMENVMKLSDAFEEYATEIFSKRESINE